MLRLIQLIRYMFNDLEYSQTEVAEIFRQIESGQFTYQDLLDNLNIESRSHTLDQLASDQIMSGKWRSVLKTAVMLDGE